MAEEKTKECPSTPESIELLKKMLADAKETADKFHKDAEVDIATLHRPMTI